MTARDDFRASACTGKQAYSIVRARELARAVSRRHDEPMQAYHCVFCHGWHVGHPRQARVAREKAQRVEKRQRRQKIEFQPG
jgi:hypothetical protein